MRRWQWILLQVSRQLWVRATLIGSLGVIAALLAAVVDEFLPRQLPDFVGSDAADSLLNIIASSMLAVTAFSLSVVTSAYANAANGVTPRATKLVMEDRITQNVLSTFVGSFLFAIVGIVVLRTGAYGERGLFMLFAVTVVVIAMIVISLLRWIGHLTKLNRPGETIERVEKAAAKAIEERVEHPFLGGRPLTEPEREIPKDAVAVCCNKVGYVQNMDMPALDDAAGENGATIYVSAIPGTFVFPHTPLAFIAMPKGDVSDELFQDVLEAYTIAHERSFDQDPRFGLEVMSEIGQRALSPGVNDPGTAIDVIGRMTRLLNIWAEGREGKDVDYENVYVPPLTTADLFEDAFMLIARDGAGSIEVQLRLQKSLAALSQIGNVAYRKAAQAQARMAWQRAEKALTHAADRTRLKQVAGALKV